MQRCPQFSPTGSHLRGFLCWLVSPSSSPGTWCLVGSSVLGLLSLTSRSFAIAQDENTEHLCPDAPPEEEVGSGCFRPAPGAPPVCTWLSTPSLSRCIRLFAHFCHLVPTAATKQEEISFGFGFQGFSPQLVCEEFAKFLGAETGCP